MDNRDIDLLEDANFVDIEEAEETGDIAGVGCHTVWRKTALGYKIPMELLMQCLEWFRKYCVGL